MMPQSRMSEPSVHGVVAVFTRYKVALDDRGSNS
jgi:hypothetical protein